MYDDKWPQLTVTGPAVTPEQAEQIIVRTDSLNLCCNDRAWEGAAHYIITGSAHPWTLSTPDERLAALRAEFDAKHRYGILTLAYLDQERITNPLPGSAGGWCDWDGRLGSRPYSIGKWPSVEEVTSDWEQIAEAFPFLKLCSQVTSFGGRDEPPRAWGTWTVEAGAAVFDPATTEPLDIGEPVPWMPGQQPIGLEKLAQVVARVREATPERAPIKPRVRTRA